MKQNCQRNKIGSILSAGAVAFFFSMSTFDTGGAMYSQPGPFYFLAEIGRATTLFLLTFSSALLWGIAIISGKFQKTIIIGIAYISFNLSISIKFFYFGHNQDALAHLLLAVIYFGFAARNRQGKLALGLDLVSLARGIALANVAVATLNALAFSSGFLIHETGRLQGLASNGNILAYSIALSSFFLIPALRSCFSSLFTLTALYFAAFFVNSYVILGTQSRGALFIIGISFVLSFWNLAPSRWRPLAVLLFVLFLYFSRDFLFNQVANIFVGRGNTRSSVLVEQFSILERNWLFGASWVKYGGVFPEQFFLGVISQLGIFGLVFLGGLVLGSVVTLRRLKRLSRGGGQDIKLISRFYGFFLIGLFLSCAVESLLAGGLQWQREELR
jgi:hypothetical protein